MSIKLKGNIIAHDGGTLILHIEQNWRRALENAAREYGNGDINITLSKYRTNRSLEQNRLMWALLEKMSQHMNGGGTGDITAWDCYIDMLERYGAKYEYIMCIPSAVEGLSKMFRAIKELEHRIYNNTDMVVCKCFYGSSGMDTSEMSQLIDGIFNECAKLGIYDAEYESLLAEWEGEIKK